jgi:SAM-dependent methyltransferase
MPGKSYSSASRGFPQLIREAAYLGQGRAADVPEKVAGVLRRLGEIERLCSERLGIELRGLRMLDVGAGQLLLQMAYFSLRNDVVGIDNDVITRGLDLRAYMRMLRTNGPQRVLETLGRKALLVDIRHRRELARQLGIERLSRLNVIQMDAADMAFQDESFDFVYSLAVFQHLKDPAKALDEMIRVLRVGAVLYLDFILYTSRTGSSDFRFLAGSGGSIPLWAHLRPQFGEYVRPNAHVNRIRLSEWSQMFELRMPGVEIMLKQPEAETLEPEARALWKRGELTTYTLDELLTAKVVVLWRKSE